jgi:hypothetical protein
MSSSSFGFASSVFALGAIALVVSCSDQTNATPSSTPTEDGGVEPTVDSGGTPDTGSGEQQDSGITGKCADVFGDKLTTGFGRIDGRVWAVQKPSDTQCVMPNRDHLIIQVLMSGAVYRLVTNVESDRNLDDGGPPPPVRLAIVPHALPEPAFSEGWHAGDITLDYPTTLGVHTDAFTPGTLDELVAKVAAEIKIGDEVSVYAQSGAGRPESAHLIHRNGKGKDGAIVVSPKTASPKFLLFQFGDQTF